MNKNIKNKVKLIWNKIDNLDVDVLYYAFIISIILVFCFLPFSVKESFNFLIFGILCLFFYKILKEERKSNNINLLDENVF